MTPIRKTTIFLCGVALLPMMIHWASCPSDALAQPGPNGLPTGLPHYVDSTLSSGIDFTHHDGPPLPGMLPTEQSRYGAGAAVEDYDRDGDLDVYLVDSAGHANRLYRNRGDGTFEDVTDLAGVGDTGFGHMALFLDLDGDGWMDLVVLNDSISPTAQITGTGGSRLYRNRGDGTFEDVTTGSGFAPVARILGGAAAGDYDRDGDLDLVVTSWFDWSIALYRNEGGFVFTDVTDAAGLRTSATFVSAWTPLFVDLDSDGRQDLFVAVDYFEDYAFRNRGDGTFEPMTIDTSVGNDMGIASGDFDGDGDIDLYTTNITLPGDDVCCNWLYRNDGTGSFENVAADYELNDTGWAWGTAFFDADLDGDLDLAAVNGWLQPQWVTAGKLFVQGADGSFADRTDECGFGRVGDSRSLVPFDADRDGDLDLLVTDVYGAAVLHENRTERPAGTGWLTVRLEGRRSNPHAIGARVVVRSGSDLQTREIVAGGSFYAGPPLEAHFGLPNAPDELIIRWPSGLVQRLQSPPTEQVLTLTEPAGGFGRPH